MEEINELLYYFSDKYGYDPLDYKINLMTGIVVPKKQEGSVNIRVGEPPQSVNPPSSVESQTAYEEDEQLSPSRKKVEIEDSVEGLRTYKIYAYSQQETAVGMVPLDAGDHLRELDDWITCNGLSYLEARRLIASLELNKRMRELYPHLDKSSGEGALSDFDEWIRCRQLSYFKVRMMIAELGQEEERSRLEAVAA